MNPTCQDISLAAKEFFEKEGLYCSEAVILAVNQGLELGQARETAVALGGALPVGMGGAGCLCGAVSGAAVALGLALGGKIERKRLRELSKIAHDEFKKLNGSTCCRVLTKKAGSDKAHYEQCAKFTAQAAEIATRLALSEQPDLKAKQLKSRGLKFGLARALRRLASRLD